MEIAGSEELLHHIRQFAIGLCLKDGPKLETHGKCAPLRYYVVSSGNLLPTFRNNLSVPSSGVKNPKKLPLLAA